MNLSEYINSLQELEDQGHGAAEVIDSNNDLVGLPEMHDDDGKPEIVICEKA